MFDLGKVTTVTVNMTMLENSAGLSLIHFAIELSMGVSSLKNVVVIQ